MINDIQIRAARAALHQHQSAFAENCNISLPLLKMLETGDAAVTMKSAEKIKRYVEQRDLEFTNDGGLRPISGQTKVYTGQDDFVLFTKDVYETVKEGGGLVYVDNVSEDQFAHHLGKENETEHVKRMSSLDNFNSHILIQQGDDNVVASQYAEYRWVEGNRYKDISYYMYGNKHATMLFSEENGELETRIYVVRDRILSERHRREFEYKWEQADSVNG